MIDPNNLNISANDVDGVLDFYASLVNSENEYDQQIVKRFTINGFKRINNLNDISKKKKNHHFYKFHNPHLFIIIY